MAALEKNNIYTARIEGYSSEGLGIARIDGQVVFVHGAVRGELCRVLVMKVLKNAAFGKVTELLEPSPERREPDCPYKEVPMEFFTTAVSSLSTVVTAIGAGVGVWGVINLMEGYGGDNPASNAHVP